MAIQATLWAFDKRKNSTKIPTDAGNVFTGELKEGFSVSELSITFNFGEVLNAPVFNYMHIPSLRRYYFIMDWIYKGGLWTASCVVDVLASYRSEIGFSYQYVSRAYSDYDPNLVDSTYITTPENIQRAHSAILPGLFFGGNVDAANGTIVAGVIGNSSGAVGAVTYYAMSFATFASFMNTMLGNISWAGISATEISTELQKALINPTQYIVSCMWFPVQFNTLSIGYSTNYLNLGWWTFPLSGVARVISSVTAGWITRTSEIEIPKHPQANSPRLAYTQCAPFSTYYLKFLPFGVFPIDSTELYDKSYLGINVEFNLLTGDAVLHVSAKGFSGVYDFENAFLVSEGKIGVQIPMGQVTANIGNYKQALTAGIASGIAQLLDNGGDI